VIHTSTSEVYGTARYVPIDENHPLQPQSPYSASKIGADQMALAGFTPQYTLRQGMQQCIDWFTQPENLSRYKIDIYNV
jgi:dTDP-D-glucose 4,6-dehydratase